MPASRPPDAMRILLWMCVIIAINQLGFGALLPVLPLSAQSFGVSVSAVGMTIAIYGLARFISAMPSGRLADHLGRRPTLALGGLVSAAGNFWCAYAGSFGEFMAARFIAGAGAGIILTIGAVILADISPVARRGRMMAAYQGTFLFAVGVGPFPGGLLAEHFGLAAPFEVYAFAGLLAGLVTWFTIPETRDFGASTAGGATPPRLPFMAQVRVLMAVTGYRLVSLVGFVQAVVRTGGLFNVVPVIAAAKLGLGAGQIGTGLAIGSVIGLLAAWPGGVIADRHGRKKVIVPSTLLTGLAMTGFCVASGFTGFVIASLLWGVATSISAAAPAAYAADSAPRGMNAAAMSTYRMLSDIGYVVGPIGLGLLVDWQGGEATLLFAAAMIIIAGLLFARYAPETHRA
ncbi:MAG: MFS transporter [Burkholderiaceae bacterium]